MTQRRSLLDRSRPFGVIFGAGAPRYEQDHKRFDHRDIEIISTATTGEATVWQPPGGTVARAEDSISPATARMRRTRQRRRAGIIVVRNFEITKKHIDVMVTRNLLMPAETADQQQVASAVRRALDAWIGSPRRKTP